MRLASFAVRPLALSGQATLAFAPLLGQALVAPGPVPLSDALLRPTAPVEVVGVGGAAGAVHRPLQACWESPARCLYSCVAQFACISEEIDRISTAGQVNSRKLPPGSLRVYASGGTVAASVSEVGGELHGVVAL